MTYDNQSLARLDELLNPCNTFLLERFIANRQNLIHQENIWVSMHSYRKRKTQVHTG